MKVLFGINNDDTVKGIIEFYEAKFNEKIEYKNVYYFKQLCTELATGEYNRAVVLEELEKYPTNNYAQIDEYLFKNIDAMTDSFDSKDIVYIASDRRKLGDPFLTKLFNLGIYTVLTGQDRTKGKVCNGIHSPFLKKDVKKYYDKEAVSENVYNEDEVSEIEIQRIVSYYKNQNGVADKYNEIFDRVSSQYTDEQLKVIVNFFPDDVKQYLSFNNEKYKQIASMAGVVTPPMQSPMVEETQEKEVLSNLHDANAVKIQKEPEMAERIVVRPQPSPNITAPVVTEVMEKEVVRSVYEVPKDYKKVVCLVGAPKVGTTFCINAIGTFLTRHKVKTAIVDVTRKRDTFTMYTYDNEGKRAIAAESIKYASNGLNEPLVYEKLSVYTAMPGEDRRTYNANKIIETVMQNNTVVLVDADFTTPPDFFRLCQNIYIVQDMDIINLQQVTMFIRELKSRGVPMNKIKLIVNKHVKCALTTRHIIDGIVTYTSYDLKMYTDLLSASSLETYVIPFDQENYRKYVEMVYKYSNQFNTFTEDFKKAIGNLINDIYPIGTLTSTSTRINNKKNNAFKPKKPINMPYSEMSDDGYEKETR